MQQQTIIIIVAIIKDPTIGIVIIAHKGKPSSSSSEISIYEFFASKSGNATNKYLFSTFYIL